MKRRPGRPAKTATADPSARERILVAAQEQFAMVGYSGARMESVARSAGCNRALVYHYFKTKAGLFTAALDRAAEHRAGQMDSQPRSLADGLVYWFNQNWAEPQRIRLVMQEALAEPFAKLRPQARQYYMDAQLDVVRAFQQGGLLRTDMDARHLLTAFLAVTSFPACFPEVARSALGAKDDAELRASWEACLRQLAEMLRPIPSNSEPEEGGGPLLA